MPNTDDTFTIAGTAHRGIITGIAGNTVSTVVYHNGNAATPHLRDFDLSQFRPNGPGDWIVV